ncbi:MAG: hypothetical protein C0P74_001050 [Gammaproteobacteria bacterium]|nr:hypothetical protein [Gammaproteobacteria bacterium]
MLKRIKNDFMALRKGAPGRRFIVHYRRHRDTESPRESRWKTVAFITAGLILIALGAVFSLVPGVPGIVFSIPGIGLLVARLKPFAIFLDRTEIAARKIWRRLFAR